jgi:hypothetical protein
MQQQWRLSLSGFYHVEFKDFWLGDMLSSQAYALGQTFLFFCLYSRAWLSPGSCSVDKLQIWGLVGALPAFFRWIQCFRRYKDSKQWFPHLPNAVKYGLILVYYGAINLWRTDKDNQLYKSVFVGVAFFASTIGCKLSFSIIPHHPSRSGPNYPQPKGRKLMLHPNSVLGHSNGLVSNEPLR